MHPKVYHEFERICASKGLTGSVLEVGAAPSDDCLLNMRALANVTEKVGVDLAGPYEFKDFKVVKANGNCMDCFHDARFDAVLCNAVLEHDKYFWKTVSEIKRVTKPGGWILFGVPGFERLKLEAYKRVLASIPFVRKLASYRYMGLLFHSTATFQVHNHPGDYYRFSRQAVAEVLLDGLEQVEVHSIMLPPRLIGVGRKKL